MTPVTIVGGGNGARTAAAELGLAGHDVMIVDVPLLRPAAAAEADGITATGVIEGFAPVREPSPSVSGSEPSMSAARPRPCRATRRPAQQSQRPGLVVQVRSRGRLVEQQRRNGLRQNAGKRCPSPFAPIRTPAGGSGSRFACRGQGPHR